MGGKIVVRNLRVVSAIDEGSGRRPRTTAGEILLERVALRSLEVYTVQRWGLLRQFRWEGSRWPRTTT